MLILKRGFIALASTALLIVTSNANALLFWSDQQPVNGARTIYNYVDSDPGPTVLPTTYTNSDGRAVKGAYGIGGTEYANGIRSINSGITMNITANNNTPQPIDSRYQGDSRGVKTADARLTASANGLIAGHGTTSNSLISESAVQTLINNGGLPNTVNPADFSGNSDPFDISTSFNISFTHSVILNFIQFDRISKGGSDESSATFNISPKFKISGGSNSIETSLLDTLTKQADDGESTLIPGGVLFLANEFYTIDVFAQENSNGDIVNSLAEFQAWDVTIAPAAVPLPGAVWLMLSGLAAVFSIGQKKSVSVKPC